MAAFEMSRDEPFGTSSQWLKMCASARAKELDGGCRCYMFIDKFQFNADDSLRPHFELT